MSLEEALAENTAAIKAHTAMLAKLGGAKAGTTASAEKPAGAAAGNKPAGGAAKNTAKPKAPTIDDIRTRFGGYLSTKDTDLRETRKEQVGRINDHFGVAKASDLDPSDFAEALGYLTAFENGEEPEFAQADGGEGGGDESLV